MLRVSDSDAEARFYRHFFALQMQGLEQGGAMRAEVVNRLQELVAIELDGQGVLLFDRLCHIAREASASATKWTRASLLAQLRGAIRLKVIPYLGNDIDRLNAYALESLNVVSERVGDFQVERQGLQEEVVKQLAQHRVVTIGGLPGCGKSAVLKHCAEKAAKIGPILFLKNDRLTGSSWSTFAAGLGLSTTDIVQLLLEIGSTGTPILFFDGIDRVRPDQQGVIVDLLNAIHRESVLHHWKVLVTSRDQGLEAFRAWFPAALYATSGIGDVMVDPFSDEEAEQLAESKPHLRKLLFGPPAVRDIARRPFFASVLNRSVPAGAEPQTEVDLIAAWWGLAGHDTPAEVIPQRKRALIDIAEKGVRNLGRTIRTRDLRDSTIAQIAGLKADEIVRDERGGAYLTFTHDIFFEWAFFQLLIDLGDDWSNALKEAGEAPLLGRVVGLMAQDALTENGRWSAGYRLLAATPLRRQWQREWLTAPPFTSAFEHAKAEFAALLKADEFALFEKVLVWFQAQHTIPSPWILSNIKSPLAGMDNLAVADMLGWPSDFRAWGRLIDWILAEADSIPVRLIAKVLGIFDVWQNVLADQKNGRSAAILRLANAWLVRFEQGNLLGTSEGDDGSPKPLGREQSEQLGRALRTIVLRSARSYPDYAIQMFQRVIANKNSRRDLFDELIGFSPIMSGVAPELLAELAEVELLQELPDDRRARKRQARKAHSERLAAVRAIPAEKRTPQQNSALQDIFFPIGNERYDLDDIGFARHGGNFFPASARHEPFKSLFENRPDVALRLVRNLVNHATKGWRQIHLINRESMGTPIPVSIEFPWGVQQFWGDWHVYNWGLGQLAPEALECAFLALSYWAFKRVDEGQSVSDVIKDVVEGNECYAVLGIALRLALEAWDTSETILAVITCQRLWPHDLARVVQEPHKDIDLFGFGYLSKLTGEKAAAKEFLDQRKSRKREIRELAMLFALSNDSALSEKFRARLAEFPNDLPYELEEQKSDDGYTAHLRREAEVRADQGDRKNYKQIPYDESRKAITYERPTPLTSNEQLRLDHSTALLKGLSVVSWANKSLEANCVREDLTLAEAVAYAKSIDSTSTFEQHDSNASSPQSVMASVAACVIRFGEAQHDDYQWAWAVMARVESLKEPKGVYGASNIPWHPSVRLVVALHHDRRSDSPRADSAERLFKLVMHPIDNVSNIAFDALFLDPEERVRWIAGQLLVNLCIVHRAVYDGGKLNGEADRRARAESSAAALHALKVTTPGPMPALPPAWIKGQGSGRRDEPDNSWQQPDVFFSAQDSAKLFSKMPLEAWMASDIYRPLFEPFLLDVVNWTVESIQPTWQTKKSSLDSRTDLFEWSRALGNLLARAVPFILLESMRSRLIKPFLCNDEAMLRVLARFADQVVCRHIFDAATIPENAIALLDDCVSVVLRDRAFEPNSWRAGEVSGNYIPELIAALLFVNLEDTAPGATRFANGDWTEINRVMPIIDRIVRHVGWSAFVMGKFLNLCDKAGQSYPIHWFGLQANAALSTIGNAKEGWTGTTLPARMAAVVQRQADWNFPLQANDAQELLKMLDSLIDLGDRRSAALEQTEAFKGVQNQ